MNVTIDLDQAVYDRIAALNPTIDPLVANQRFFEFAVQHMERWAAGNARFRSLTDQYLLFAEDFFSTVAPETGLPDYNNLYNKLNMSAGQAAYISRALADKFSTQWRQTARWSLKAKLDAKRAEALEVEDMNRFRTVEFQLTKLETAELKVMFTRIWQLDNTLIPPITKNTFGDVMHVAINYTNIILLTDPQ